MTLIVVESEVSLAPYTTLAVGGEAAYFSRLTDESQLPELVAFAIEQQVPITVLGGGSNVLIADGTQQRLFLRNELKGKERSVGNDGMVRYTVAAGESWDVFVAQTVVEGLAGLENLSGIPGTVGAAPIQNINAYGAQVADVIESVTVFDTATNTFKVLANKACQFAYRDSVFKTTAGASLIVTAVTFVLAPAVAANLSYRSASQSIARYLAEKQITTPSVREVRDAILHVRGAIGMLEGQFRSAGSFFKNTIVPRETFTQVEAIVCKHFATQHAQFSPWYWELGEGQIKISTAFLMECSSYNKNTYGEKRWHEVVGLSPRHSLSIVTEVGATASDVQNFVAEIITAIETIFSITIEAEVNVIA